MKPIFLAPMFIALLVTLPARAERYETPAGSKTVTGAEAAKLFREVVAAGFEAKDLERWHEVKRITVSTGAISCFSEVGYRELGMECSDSRGPASIVRSFQLFPLASRGTRDVRFSASTLKVTDITCVVTFEKDEVNRDPSFRCLVKYPAATYDDAE